MQTVNLQYNVPAGYSLEEFVAKVNSYVARLAKKCQAGEEYEPNEETKAAIREAQAHIEAYKRGEEWAKKDVFDNVDDLMADLMKEKKPLNDYLLWDCLHNKLQMVPCSL